MEKRIYDLLGLGELLDWRKRLRRECPGWGTGGGLLTAALRNEGWRGALRTPLRELQAGGAAEHRKKGMAKQSGRERPRR